MASCTWDPLCHAGPSQVAAFASVTLYTAFYVGEARLEATTLYVFVSTLTTVSIISFGVLLLTMERKFVRTRMVHRGAYCVHPDRHSARARCEAAQCAGAGHAPALGP